MRAIRAAHAFDGLRFLPGGVTLLLEADQIVGVEPAQFHVPHGVELARYDGTVLPGLIDCHTHLVADSTLGGLERAAVMSTVEIDDVIAASLRAHAAAGVTTVRDLGDRDYRTLAFRDRPGAPRVVAAGPPLTTPGGHCHFLGGAVDADPRAAVAEHVDRGVDVIKMMASGGFATPGTDPLGGQFTVPELAAAVGEAHAAGLPAVAHAHSVVAMQNALAAGVDGIEHFSGLSAEGPRIEDDLLEETARRGVYVDLTMGSDPAELARMPAPPPAIAQIVARLGLADFEEFYLSRIAVIGRLREHGIRLIAGVDSGMAPAKRHGNVWRTVGEMVEGGYPVAEALAAATSVAAEACGLAGVTGRLAAGHAADLMVVDGDVATDPSLLGGPRAVLIRGTPVALGVRPSTPEAGTGTMGP